MKNLLIVLVLLIVQVTVYSGNDSPKNGGVVFGRIYTGFYYNLNQDQPGAGFDFTTGILGYRHQIADNVNAVLIYDVTRTTNIYSLMDLSGDTINLDYFEGSKYTAFLKMAQIDWRITPKIKLSVGQLLNEQYLTVHDKWWGFRYVDVTFQEKFRYGMPADFGARLTYNLFDRLNVSYSIVNGEGPFRHQSDELFLQSLNVEYKPADGFMVKAYVAKEDTPDGEGLSDKYIASFFAGFKNNDWMFGVESNFVENYSFLSDKNLTGFSIYSSKAISNKLKGLVRLDYGNLNAGFSSSTYSFYVLTGIEYQPVKNFGCAVTYRMNDYVVENEVIPQVNINFGMKF